MSGFQKLADDVIDGYKAGLRGEPIGIVNLAFDTGWLRGDHDRRIGALAPRPAAPASVAPPGWKLVPIEPTREMIDAYMAMNGRFQSARSDWAAMLAASPQPTTSAQEWEK